MLNADLDFGDRDKGEREGFPATWSLPFSEEVIENMQMKVSSVVQRFIIGFCSREEPVNVWRLWFKWW